MEALVTQLGIDRVRFLGAVPDARQLYPGFDVLLSASDAEGLPNAVLEAAAAACPIVATDAGGTREIVDDGLTGLLAPVGDVAGLSAALTRVFQDPDLATRLAGAARAHVARIFGADRFVAETAALYDEMMARDGG